MAPPPHEALSGISGSISLACWIFVLIPQLIENYRCGSADGISLVFLFVWLVGDLANFIGAVWAGLVPTVIALAVYFCIADVVLLAQCLYYRSRNSKKADAPPVVPENDPRQPLLNRRTSDIGLPGSRRRSTISRKSLNGAIPSEIVAEPQTGVKLARIWVKNTIFLLFICTLGVAGWVVAWQTGLWEPDLEDDQVGTEENKVGAVVLGYLSAVCYLGARIPQIIKNFKEKSCEGLAIMFFVLSLAGNLTYGGGILFHSVSKDYILTNLPWLIGSLGTMVEDIIIFVQFRIYGEGKQPSETAILSEE